ncbi:ATP-grasp domain-containing protein [Butyrivibrio sp. NC2007]|uniref:ATP-grasp domain-containing protein n=1 Tax=Butyrivibrio sp. NC2007 TaxID=1280683 RepID=UPI0012DEF81E|nr:ATP-grasp domain-containing protein [Butyrivibrio sp. NC2007]
MDIRKYSDDFFTIGDIAILQRTTGNDGYDFNFRNCFECRSVVSEVDEPVLLHIGAIEDYAGVEATIEEMGMHLLIHEAEHIRCSTIEKWYPTIKERTPYTQIYDELPPLENVTDDFSFPFFVKGNRQTNHHKKSQCIIENADQYYTLRNEWGNDKILNWQKVAIREYVPLKVLDSTSFPDSVPISYEFRFFYFEGRCMAYGPYWNIGPQYSLSEGELPEVLELTDWAAHRLGVSFPAIDVAKTVEGDWIIIEVNDAQESGFVGVNPLKLWNCTIDAMQERNWIAVEDLFDEGTVIMGGNPLPDKTVEEMWYTAKNYKSIQELVDAYVGAHNKYGFIEDEIYDYEEGTEEYEQTKGIIDAWAEVEDYLQEKVVSCAKEEGLLAPRQKNSGLIKQMEEFMAQYGYRDGRGWWVRLDSENNM